MHDRHAIYIPPVVKLFPLHEERPSRWGRFIHSPNFIAVIAIVGMLIAGVVVMSGCEPAGATGKSTTSSLHTYEHDGHWWVIYSYSHQGNVLHHPDCPKCSANVEAE